MGDPGTAADHEAVEGVIGIELDLADEGGRYGAFVSALREGDLGKAAIGVTQRFADQGGVAAFDPGPHALWSVEIDSVAGGRDRLQRLQPEAESGLGDAST